MRRFDDAILTCIEPYLTPDVIADAIQAAVKRAGSRAAVDAERQRIARELKMVDAELGRLVAFIKRGTASEAVQAELTVTEAKRGDLRTALARLAQADAFRATAADLETKLGSILRTGWPSPRSRSRSSGNSCESSCRRGSR